MAAELRDSDKEHIAHKPKIYMFGYGGGDCFQEPHPKYQHLKKKIWVPVTHTCNPNYSEGRDQEDCGSKPAQEK
jgi:hypothetical protein